MEKNIEYYVDEKQFTTIKSELTVAEILAEVGMSAHQFCLVSEDNVEYCEPKKTIKVYSGAKFKTRKREDFRPIAKTVHYTVNGETQTTEQETLTVETILRNAGAAASIDISQIDSYYLESVDNDHKYENLSDLVTVHENERFLAVHRGKTPVA
ncbi:MAG: hypothetical protein OXK72_08140 [Gammaproteobacteria bacterium]|nr:hypothetical protein [Gammaproteobacteria bacterium]MDE0412528.1 hypothetical protein [Gammaproteobacteria bacterium]